MFNRDGTSGGMIALDQSRSCRACPTEVQRRSQEQNIEPVREKRRPVDDELGKQPVENGIMDTANRNMMWIHERLRSERARWLSCVCWPIQKIPSVRKLIRYMTSRGDSATMARQIAARHESPRRPGT